MEVIPLQLRLKRIRQDMTEAERATRRRRLELVFEGRRKQLERLAELGRENVDKRTVLKTVKKYHSAKHALHIFHIGFEPAANF